MARRVIPARQILLLVFAVASVTASLVLRVVHRGFYYPGWEVVGASQGLFEVSTKTPAHILASFREAHDAWNTFGIPSALLPGWLASHWSSEWWPHRVTFALTLVSLALVARAFDAWVIVLLVWGASGVLLTWSIVGFAYISNVLPYAVAFWVIQRWRSRPLVTLLLAGLAEAAPRLIVLWDRVRHVQIDVPVLMLAGLVAALLTPRDRWTWRIVVGVQLGLVVLLAINGGTLQGPQNVWPRRVILLDFVSLAAVAAFTAAARPRARTAMVALLLAGNLWQLADVVRWSRLPVCPPGTDRGFTMPFTESTLDYYVPFFPVDWYREMRARLDAGKKLLVLYNLTSYDENNTNPSGILERLYLHLGSERFAASVLVFGSDRVRWDELPLRPFSEMPATLDAIADPEAFAGYVMIHPLDAKPSDWTRRHREEMATVLRAVGERFRVEWAEPEKDVNNPTLLRFTIHRL